MQAQRFVLPLLGKYDPMGPEKDKRTDKTDKPEKKPAMNRSPHRSPLDGLLEDPKQTDHGVGSLDKALWDPSRDKSEVEQNSGK